MTFELSEIKHIRKKLGMTQAELAKRANVSQSLVAKIESGRIDPAHSKVKKIADALNCLNEKREKKAEDVMQSRVITIESQKNLGEAIAKMKKYSISQMPVVEGNDVVGIISETIILDAMTKNKKDAKMKDVMQDIPPMISKNTQVDVLSDLLKYYPFILVTEHRKLIGIVTKSDIITKGYKN